jgi:predicted Zn-dependent peptidase
MKVNKYVLNNGLRIVLSPMRDTQAVAIQILVEAGSKYENKKNNGISHFLEHMMFKGTKKRPKAKMISEQLDSVGAEYNAFTGQEQTGYWVKLPKDKFSLGLDVVSDLYLNPLLKEEDIQTEKGVILQEAAMYQDTPMLYISDVFGGLIYGDQPAGWPVIGTNKNIISFKRKDFVDYIEKHYQPSKTVLSVAGNFDGDKALDLIKGIFGSLRNKRTFGKKRTVESQTRPRLKIINKKTEQTHLMLGVRSCDMFSEDRHTASIMSVILGSGMSSRMFLNIREKHGLTYYISAANNQSTDAGYFFVKAGVQHNNLQKAVKLIIRELQKIKEKKVSKRELSKAMEYLKGGLLMNLEASDEVASFFGNQELYRKEVKQPEELIEKLEKVTEDDILKLAKKIFVNRGLNLAVIGPHQDKEKDQLEKILKI